MSDCMYKRQLQFRNRVTPCVHARMNKWHLHKPYMHVPYSQFWHDWFRVSLKVWHWQDEDKWKANHEKRNMATFPENIFFVPRRSVAGLLCVKIVYYNTGYQAIDEVCLVCHREMLEHPSWESSPGFWKFLLKTPQGQKTICMHSRCFLRWCCKHPLLNPRRVTIRSWAKTQRVEWWQCGLSCKRMLWNTRKIRPQSQQATLRAKPGRQC